MKAGHLGDGLDVCFPAGGARDGDVIEYGTRIEKGLLQYDADMLSQPGTLDARRGPPIKKNTAAGGVIQALQKQHEGGFATARGA